MAPYDIIGNIAIIKFNSETSMKVKKKYAKDFLKNHKHISTVVEKTGKFSGRLRTQATTYLSGEDTKEALCKENGCSFRLNIDSCYFSPRLSSERKEIAEIVKKGENVLVMFGGVAPFAIVIAKLSKADKVVSVELGRECTRYAKVNVKRNKVDDKVEIIGGDVRKKLPLMEEKFDRIVMARPNLKDDFLDVAFSSIKKNGVIHYYGFYYERDLDELEELIKNKALETKKKIKVLRIKRAGNIGTGRYRYRVDLKVFN